jgi:hypothetical protein
MVRSGEQSAHFNIDSLNEGDPVEPPDIEPDVSPSPIQNKQAAAADVDRGRPTRRGSDHGGSSGMNGASASSQQSHRRDSSRSSDRVLTQREGTAAQPNSHSSSRAERSNLDTEDSTSPQSVDTISAQEDNDNENDNDHDNDHDPHRRQGFRLGDLVLDFFLPHPRARVEDTPIYRVTAWDAEASIYRLLLYRDPTGRAPLFTVRNWGQIRLADVQDDEWEDLE